MLTALHAVAAKRPKHLVCAVPVGAHEAVNIYDRTRTSSSVSDPSMEFFAISQCYRRFPQVDDDEVVAILRG